MALKNFEKIDFRNFGESLTVSDAESFMQTYVKEVYEHKSPSLIWLLTHPSTLTAGTSAKNDDLLNKEEITIHQSGRGGEWTYHGPGQRIAYTMLDLSEPKGTVNARDIRSLVTALENWVIAALKEFGLDGFSRSEFPGVWIKLKDGRPAKIAALGLRVRHWVSFHGVSINVNPDMKNYERIKPCGLEDPVTSLHELGIQASFEDLDKALLKHAPAIFGPINVLNKI